MDSKNVIAAISLSAAVIILYSLFFAPEPQQIQKAQEQSNEIVKDSEAPKLTETQEIKIVITGDQEKVGESNDIHIPVMIEEGGITTDSEETERLPVAKKENQLHVFGPQVPLINPSEDPNKNRFYTKCSKTNTLLRAIPTLR